jgi:hypothetical protein
MFAEKVVVLWRPKYPEEVHLKAPARVEYDQPSLYHLQHPLVESEECISLENLG